MNNLLPIGNERVSPSILVFDPVLTRRLPRSPGRLHRCAHSGGATRGPRGCSGRSPAARSPTEPHNRQARCRRDRTARHQIGRVSWFREIPWAKVSPDLSIPAEPSSPSRTHTYQFPRTDPFTRQPECLAPIRRRNLQTTQKPRLPSPRGEGQDECGLLFPSPPSGLRPI